MIHPEPPDSSGHRPDEPRRDVQRSRFADIVEAQESTDFTRDAQEKAARGTRPAKISGMAGCFNDGVLCCIHESSAPQVITRTPEAAA